MMRKTTICLLLALASLSGLRAEDDLAIARAALRDGLWQVARTYAGRGTGDEFRLVTLESYAREESWSDLLGQLDAWPEATGEPFAYYRALALLKSGQAAAASNVLAAVEFKTAEFSPLSRRLQADVCQALGDGTKALEIVRDSLFPNDVEAVMQTADVLWASGDREGAESLWRSVIATSNAAERAVAVAAANLGDVAALRRTFASARDADVRTLSGSRLAMRLLAEPSMAEEGERLVRSLVRERPDSELVRQAFLALADSLLSRGEFVRSSDAYAELVETWPELLMSSTVSVGRGWALLRRGAAESALEQFRLAEKLATNDTDRAAALLKQGDALSELGRGEESMASYRAVLEKYPLSPAGKLLQGFIHVRELESKGRDLFRDCRFKEAEAAFLEVAAADPTRKPRMDYLRVLCQYGQGFDDEAERRARSVAATSPDARVRAAATHWLAKYAYNRGKWEEACRLFTAFADMEPTNPHSPEALVWAGRAAFAANEFDLAIETGAKLAQRYPASAVRAESYLIQGEALIALSRFDEALLMLESAPLDAGLDDADKLRVQLLKADALYAMGTGDADAYARALEAYRAVGRGSALTPPARLAVAYKTGRALEKLRRTDEAIDEYYVGVVLAYREGRMKGEAFDDEARAVFARAAFRLADEYERRGMDFQAMHVLELVVASDVPASDEAEKRIDRIQTKGRFL